MAFPRIVASSFDGSLYGLITPLSFIQRLALVFFIEKSNLGPPYYSVRLISYYTFLYWCIFFYALYVNTFECCGRLSTTCILPLTLDTIFVPLCIITESKINKFINSVDAIDNELLLIGESLTIDTWTRKLKLLGFMSLHIAVLVFNVFYGEAVSLAPVHVQLTLIYWSIQRRLAYVWYQTACDEMGLRYRLLERCWVRACIPSDMERIRILRQKLHEAVALLGEGYGPRLLLLMLDISIQTTRFFVFTFIYRINEANSFFVLFTAYNYYCLHTTVTATENMIVKSNRIMYHLMRDPMSEMTDDVRTQVELLWTHVDCFPLEVSVCGIFAYNRALILSLVSALMSVWVLIIQAGQSVCALVFEYPQKTLKTQRY